MSWYEIERPGFQRYTRFGDRRPHTQSQEANTAASRYEKGPESVIYTLAAALRSLGKKVEVTEHFDENGVVSVAMRWDLEMDASGAEIAKGIRLDVLYNGNTHVDYIDPNNTDTGWSSVAAFRCDEAREKLTQKGESTVTWAGDRPWQEHLAFAFQYLLDKPGRHKWFTEGSTWPQKPL